MDLKKEMQKIREEEAKYPAEYFVKDALKVCEYSASDGYPLTEIADLLEQFTGNTKELYAAYGKYYGSNNMILPQYRAIAGYMQCIGHDIRMLDTKVAV